MRKRRADASPDRMPVSKKRKSSKLEAIAEIETESESDRDINGSADEEEQNEMDVVDDELEHDFNCE